MLIHLKSFVHALVASLLYYTRITTKLLDLNNQIHTINLPLPTSHQPPPRSGPYSCPTMDHLPQIEKIAMLALSREQCRNHLSSTQNQTFDKIVVGAAIIHLATGQGSEFEQPRILLLKRSADEEYYPNVFEMPGGKVDPEDANIRDALSREVKEETGLDLTHMLARLPDMTYSTEKMIRQEDGSEKLSRKSCIQLNFAVEVDSANGMMFRVNPSEHSTGLWANKKMLGQLEMTDQMRDIVSIALDHYEVISRIP
jgi:ADP-ribose pyrophosphatase YjhB (NUDIX family)